MMDSRRLTRDGQQKVIASTTGSAGFPRFVMQVVDTGSAANGLMEIALTAARISTSATLSSSMSYSWVVSVLARPRRGRTASMDTRS